MTNKGPLQPFHRLLKATMLIVGFGLGFLLVRAFTLAPRAWPEGIMYVAFTLLAIIVAGFLQLIIHEVGHLISGLLTGYRFSSFRILSFILVRNQEGFKFARYWIPETGGQCLLEPPAYENHAYKLYHMGGSALNLLTAIVAFVLSSQLSPLPSLFLQALALTGLYFALVNGIPIKTDQVSNDGANLLILSKSEAARRSIWTALQINALQTQGLRLKDMPETYFDLQQSDNFLASMHSIFVADRYMDQHEFTKAAHLIDKLVATNKIFELQKTVLQANRIFIALIQDDLELAKTIYEEECENLHKMRKQLAVMRTEWAFERKVRGGDGEEYLKEFKKLAKRHPYQSEVEAEVELLAMIDEYEIKADVLEA